MLKLRPILSGSYLMKAWNGERNKINTRHAHEAYFASEDEIMENVLGHFITIGINLPDSDNVLNETALEKLCSRIKKFEENNDIRVAILHGSGGNFCSGMVATDAAKKLAQDLLKILHTLKKPIIAALDGYTKDFGLYLAAMCDIRVMDRSALIGLKDKVNKLELPPFMYERLILTVGLAKTFELVCTRQTWTAAESLAMGLVNKTVDQGCVLGQSMVLAQNIAFRNSLEELLEHKSKILSFIDRKL